MIPAISNFQGFLRHSKFPTHWLVKVRSEKLIPRLKVLSGRNKLKSKLLRSYALWKCDVSSAKSNIKIVEDYNNDENINKMKINLYILFLANIFN